ncbi:MAG: hypothetical protein EOO51_05315 [Flavobacterium sp.]|nr:MAG: hypothetical protein EOO51_05315 [Flavobacterium sp.]
MEVIAQFRIEDEALITPESNNEEIKSTIIARLRNRSAIFDRLVEAGFDENLEQLVDENPDEEFVTPEEVNLKTLVNVAFEVNVEALKALEANEDLVFVKALSEVEHGQSEMETVQQRYDTSLVIFRKK